MNGDRLMYEFAIMEDRIDGTLIFLLFHFGIDMLI